MSFSFKLTPLFTAAALLLPSAALAERAGLPGANEPEARGKAIAEKPMPPISALAIRPAKWK